MSEECAHCNHQGAIGLAQPQGGLKLCVCRQVAYCNTTCQKADWKNHRPNCPPFILKDSPDKGKGLFATRNLKVGSLILCEDYLLLVVKGKSSYASVMAAFKTLSESDKKKVLSLYYIDEGDDPMEAEDMVKARTASVYYPDDVEDMFKVLKIFEVNTIAVCSEENEDQESALYYNISRLNHSCAPNAVWSFKEENLRQKEVRACNPIAIAAGEEILVSYLTSPSNMSFSQRDERRSKLKMSPWKFDCQCQVCALTGEELATNEQLRAEIKRHHEYVPFYLQKVNFPKALTSALMKLKYMRKIKEDVILDFPGALLECYEILCIASASLVEINPETISASVRVEQDRGTYVKEALDITQKLRVDCLHRQFKVKMRKITEETRLIEAMQYSKAPNKRGGQYKRGGRKF